MTDKSTNIAFTLAEQAHIQPTNCALVEAAGGRSFSFRQLNCLADGYAHYLSENGVSPGNRVMLMVKPGADFIAFTFALFKIGAPVILIDPGMGYKNLLSCIASVRPEVFIGIPKAHLFKTLFRKPFQTIKHSFCYGRSFGLFGPDIAKKAGNNEQSFTSYPARAFELAAIIFTTGSTGPPKGVQYEHGVFQAQLRLIRDYYGVGPDDVDQPGFPLFALFSTALGAKAVIPDMDPTQPAKVDPERFIASIREYGVSYSFGSPAIWNVISNYCLENSIVLSSLRLVLMAGAPISGELIERMQRILPPEAKIHTPYGATESLPIVSMEGSEIVKTTWNETKKGRGTCVGRALPGIDVRIIDSTDTPIEDINEVRFLEENRVGEIIVQGDVVTRAYDNNTSENRLAKIIDGKSFWHRLGDLGYKDSRGRLWFCGRKAHRLETAQGLMFTICCEAIVNEHQDIFRSALVGISDPENQGMKLPLLIVEPKSDFRGNEEELLTEIRALAKASVLTKNIDRFLIHPSFPVDIRHNAKIFREKLAVWAEKKLGVNN